MKKMLALLLALVMLFACAGCADKDTAQETAKEPEGIFYDLTGMDPTSKLAIDAEGVFTTDFADAATAKQYLECFTVPTNYKPVEVIGKALSTELEIDKLIEREMAVANAVKATTPAEVIAGTTCPMCGAENVTWTKCEGTYWAIGTKHIYFEGALGTAEEPFPSANFIAGDEGAKLCVVLVDADIHTTGRILLRPNNVFNFMGTGTLTSDGTCTEAAGYVDRGLFNFVGANIELNLYGGNYQYTGAGFGTNVPATTGNAAYALLNVSAQSQVNIFNDTVIGPAEKDTTRAYYNVYTLGKVNMFGGTIQNGISKTEAAGGNVTVSTNGTLNMYGGTIKDGETDFRGGNVLLHSYGNVHMEHADALITGGAAVNGSNNSGGGNIATRNDTGYAHVYMNAGTISNGRTVSKADFKGGGNIFMYGVTDIGFIMNGGTVIGGSSGYGGNIYVRNGAYVTVGKDAVIADGTASLGGNVFLFNGSTMTTEGTIKNGTASYGGGNFYLGHSSGKQNTVTMNGGAVFGGTVTGTEGANYGGNFRVWDNGKLVVNDGYIYGGTNSTTGVNANGANIMVGASTAAKAGVLEINGGHIAGDVRIYGTATAQAKVKLSGAPEIAETITLPDGTTASRNYAGMFVVNGVGIAIDISGLKPEASIRVSGVADQVFTAASENAAAVAGCFKPTNAALTVEATAENVLKIVTAPVAE